MKILFFVN